MNAEVVLAIVGVLATAVGALVWVIKHVFDRIIPVIESLERAIKENSERTKENREYLEHRNGRDAEAFRENMEMVRKIHEAIKQKG